MFDIIDDKPLRDCLEFIVKIDDLKTILRKTRVIGEGRRENTAEHSWHLILMALVLERTANTPVKIDRVIKMLALHDLGEIEAGDVFLYDTQARIESHDKERLTVERLFSLLPQELCSELMTLWEEFNTGTTAESQFARALDRFQPFLSNLATSGGTWKEFSITKDQALAKNISIAEGSKTLWRTYQDLAEAAERKSYFHVTD